MNARPSRGLFLSRRGRAGHGAVELAIALPLLMLLTFGAGDFGRIFYASITVANAAETGALYGSHDVGQAYDKLGITTAVKNDTQDLSGVTVDVKQVCECPDQSSISCDASVSCPAGGLGLGGATPKKRLYSQVTANYTFNEVPLINYPGLPASVKISKQVVMRVQ